MDELNQWTDESPRHRDAVDLLRQKEYTTQEDKGVAPEQAVQALYAGAFALVVGGAITRPAEITARFTGAINAMNH